MIRPVFHPVPSGKQDEREIRERKAKAVAMVTALNHPGEEGGRRWELSIPARRDYDPDLVIVDSLGDIDRLLSLLDAERKRVQELEGALRFYKETADLFGYEFGIYEASLCEATQVKRYKCSGCDAEGESHWPDWVVTFVHKDHCRFVKAEALLPKEQKS